MARPKSQIPVVGPQDPEDNEGHPLFPVDEGEEAPAIGWIQVRRAEAGAGWVTAPQKFRAHELTSEEDLHRMYGGGTYELYGRAMTAKGFMGPIMARRTLTLAGKPKPLIAAPEPEETDEDEASHDGAAAPYFPGMGGPNVDVGQIIASLQQSAQAQQAQQLALFTQFMQQQAAMFQAQIASSKSEGQTVAQLMIEQSRAQAEMFRMQAQKAEAIAERALNAKESGTQNGLESTLRLMDLLERRVEARVREVEKKTKGEGDDDMTGPLLTLAGGLMQAMANGNQNAAPPPAPPSPPLPPPVAQAPQGMPAQAPRPHPAPVAAPPPPAHAANGAGAAAALEDTASEADAAAIN